jgi:C-terminal processing protease CtpA/Prc
LALFGLVEEIFRERYAPAEYKAATLGWQREHVLAELRGRLLAEPPPSNEQIRRALYDTFRSPQDIHTGVDFEARGGVWLGLHLRRAGGGFHLAWIDRTQLPVDRFPFELGDEVIRFDGRPVSHAIAETTARTKWRSTPDFEASFAEWFLTFRGRVEWGEVPVAGTPVELQIVRDGAPRSVRLPWLDLDQHPPSARSPFWGKTRQSYLPQLGPEKWRSDPAGEVPAYVFEAPGGPFGYLRIYSYALPPDRQLAAIEQMDRIADAFLAHDVRAVVVDQLGNGGGNFLFGFALLARFIERPMVPPLQQYRLLEGGHVVGIGPARAIGALVDTLGGVQTDAGAAAFLAGHPLFVKGLSFAPRTVDTIRTTEDYFRFFLGKPPGLTELHFQIVRQVSGRGPTFSGPLLLLIDELNLSAAEYVAATLVDNRRAVAFGAPTSGAGGDQRWIGPDRLCPPGHRLADELYAECMPQEIGPIVQALGVSGLAYTITLGRRVFADGSLGEVIENRGVAPQVEYRITADDLRSGFEPMRARIVQALAELAGGSPLGRGVSR